jgi:dihydroorotase-like cyclic amidohydrolase
MFSNLLPHVSRCGKVAARRFLHRVIRNGTIVTSGESFVADVSLVDDKIDAVGVNLPKGEEEIDATGMLVIPGAVDPHVHLQVTVYLRDGV